MKVILLGHQKRQGKDTVAEIIKKHTGAEILRFADAMKEILADTLGVSVSTLNDMKNESQEYRAYLQRFGSGKMKEYFGKQVWVDVVMRELMSLEQNKCPVAIVTDFRFPEEWLPESITVNVTGRVESTDTHISENALNDFNYDYTIINDGSLEELEAKVLQLLKEKGIV